MKIVWELNYAFWIPEGNGVGVILMALSTLRLVFHLLGVAICAVFFFGQDIIICRLAGRRPRVAVCAIKTNIQKMVPMGKLDQILPILFRNGDRDLPRPACRSITRKCGYKRE